MSVELTKAKRRLWIAAATGAYAGYFPVAPGTAGSLVGVFFAWLFGNSPAFLLLLSIGLSIVGAQACAKANSIFRRADSPRIVIDEIVGMMITMIGIPITGYWLVVGFIWFRIFDIFKPPPARYFDTHLKTGWGVMLDDIVAGIYSNVLLQLMLRTTI